ncbi:MAG TPA: hypothetical protein DCS19_04165 [Flavobacterium sp.]|nr:hypothetical protein [Flavobacterium sp.]
MATSTQPTNATTPNQFEVLDIVSHDRKVVPAENIAEITAGADIAANLFVGLDMEPAGAAEACIGISQFGAIDDTENGYIKTAGISYLKLGANSLTVGAELTSKSDGTGVAIAATGLVNAILLEAGGTGDVRKVLLVKYWKVIS